MLDEPPGAGDAPGAAPTVSHWRPLTSPPAYSPQLCSRVGAARSTVPLTTTPRGKPSGVARATTCSSVRARPQTPRAAMSKALTAGSSGPIGEALSRSALAEAVGSASITTVYEPPANDTGPSVAAGDAESRETRPQRRRSRASATPASAASVARTEAASSVAIAVVERTAATNVALERRAMATMRRAASRA